MKQNIFKRLEDLLGTETWYFYLGMLTMLDIQLLCGIYILPKILKELEAYGVI